MKRILGGWTRLSLRGKLFLLAWVGALGVSTVVGVSYRTAQEVRVGGALYDKIVMGKDLIADILPPLHTSSRQC